MDNKIIEFNFKLIYYRIKGTGTYFKSWERGAWCAYCLRSGITSQVEDTGHIFMRCPIADLTWTFIRNHLSAAQLPIYGHSEFNGAIGLSKLKLFFKVGITKDEAHFISEVLFLLWRNRCVNYHQGLMHDHFGIIRQLIAKLKLSSRIDKGKLSALRHFKRWHNLSLVVDALSTPL